MELLLSPWVLLAIPIVVGLLRAPVGSPGWAWATDLPLAIALGAAGSLVGHHLLGHLYSAGSPYFFPDDVMVCTTIGALRGIDEGVMARQPVAALLPWVFGLFQGTMRGLATSAIVARALQIGSIYAIGRLLHSRTAGVAAAAWSLTIAHGVLMTRHLTMYPVSAGLLALSVALGCAALGREGWRAALLAGIGSGVAFAADYSGLTVGLVLVMVGGWRGLVGARRRPRGHLLAVPAAVVIPVLLSWGLSRAVTPPEMSSLERETLIYLADAGAELPAWAVGPDGRLPDRLVAAPMVVPSEPATLPALAWRVLPDLGELTAEGNGYRWGRIGPVGLVRTVLGMALLTRGARDPSAALHGSEDHWTLRDTYVRPWLGPLAGALLLTLVALRRRPAEALGLLLLLLPFASTLDFQWRTRVLPRFLMVPLALAPVLLGLASVAFARTGPVSRRWLPSVTAALLGALVTALALGLPPTWLSPVAPWRVPVEITDDAIGLHSRSRAQWSRADAERADGQRGWQCRVLFYDDVQRGLEPLDIAKGR